MLAIRIATKHIQLGFHDPPPQGGLLNELPYRHRQQRSDKLPLEEVCLIEERAGSDPVGSMASRLAPTPFLPSVCLS